MSFLNDGQETREAPRAHLRRPQVEEACARLLKRQMDNRDESTQIVPNSTTNYFSVDLNKYSSLHTVEKFYEG